MVLFRKHDFALFSVERYGWIARLEDVIEIELLRFDMTRNISVVVFSDCCRFRCKVCNFIESCSETVYNFDVEMVLGDILVQYI